MPESGFVIGCVSGGRYSKSGQDFGRGISMLLGG